MSVAEFARRDSVPPRLMFPTLKSNEGAMLNGEIKTTRLGDVLTAIDGVAAARFTLDEISQMLKQQGREYQLSFKRGGGALAVKIKMRRLI